jgi:hypothetical protein
MNETFILAQSITDFIPTAPAWGALMPLAPLVQFLVGVALAATAVFSLVMGVLNFARASASNDTDTHSLAMSRVRFHAILFLVAAFGALFFLGILIGLVDTGIPG